MKHNTGWIVCSYYYMYKQTASGPMIVECRCAAELDHFSEDTPELPAWYKH